MGALRSQARTLDQMVRRCPSMQRIFALVGVSRDRRGRMRALILRRVALIEDGGSGLS